ncbi:hypothetical protein [Sphingomonas sp. DC2300-3]|uniref:hypothetical protein n=1 Tax=unclassified Sphingomonas TaxID=196159 RepID=UPI003CF369D3
MSRGHDPHARLLKSLERSARNYGVGATFSDFSETPWSSATFVGYRLTMAVTVDGDATAWFAALPEEEVSAPGRLVADLAVRRDAHGTRLELLVLLEA